MEHNIVLPSKPRIVSEEANRGVYEIDNLYPGYGHTLGNSLRRIILSSLPGFAITSIKIDGVPHEFSTIAGIKEDVVNILLNLKKVRFSSVSDEPQMVKLSVKGAKEVSAKDIDGGSAVTILNPEQHIATLTDKSSKFEVELMIEKGLGYVAKETIQKEKVDIGTIAVDAIFTPIRRANYEVEQMRVGNRTDYNRLRIHIETDGTITPREALEHSILAMIHQLSAIVGFEAPKAEEPVVEIEKVAEKPKVDPEILKTRIETLELSARTTNALLEANVRTVGGLLRKKEEDLLDIGGMGTKGIQEVKKALSGMGLSLRG